VSKVYKHLSNYDRFYGFEKVDAIVIGICAVIFFFLFEMIIFGCALIASYIVFCLAFKRKKPLGWLQSYLNYQLKPKVYKPGGANGRLS
jgi:hypothetical protein